MVNVTQLSTISAGRACPAPSKSSKEAALATAGMATRSGEPHQSHRVLEWMPSKQDTMVAV